MLPGEQLSESPWWMVNYTLLVLKYWWGFVLKKELHLSFEVLHFFSGTRGVPQVHLRMPQLFGKLFWHSTCAGDLHGLFVYVWYPGYYENSKRQWSVLPESRRFETLNECLMARALVYFPPIFQILVWFVSHRREAEHLELPGKCLPQVPEILLLWESHELNLQNVYE